MKKNLIFLLCISLHASSQIVPSNTEYNQNIEWENVFTSGPEGKVNRGLVDSDGNCALVFMPNNMARVHKVDGNNGQLIWTKTLNNKVGFGISEYYENGRVDYIVCGGSGTTQERWIARLNGDDGTIIWDKTYSNGANLYEFDGIRMTISASDGYIYAAGFVNGDEAGTIFVVYAGQEVVMKIDPTDGSEIWSNINLQSEYSIALVESSDGYLYSAGTEYEQDLKLTKLDKSGNHFWTRNISSSVDIIPADLAIDNDDNIYYGGHAGRSGAGDPFDYSCVKLDTDANVNWIKHYANPRGYSLDHIRNELYGIKIGNDGIYMFGGTGDEGNYSAINPPFLSSDIWNGWVLQTDFNGAILRSDIFCQDQVNTATEYGDLVNGGFVIFNDTDAQGDTEVGVMKIINGSNTNYNLINLEHTIDKNHILKINFLGQQLNQKSISTFDVDKKRKILKKIVLDY